MRRLVPMVVLLAACTAPMRALDSGAPLDTCVTDSARTCEGPCNPTQQCSGGAWGACQPSCPSGSRCDGTDCVTSDGGTSDAGTTCAGGACDAGAGCDATSCPSGCCDGTVTGPMISTGAFTCSP